MRDDNGTHEVTSQDWSPDTLAAAAALRRAAIKAQYEAITTVGSFPIWKDGKVEYATEIQVLLEPGELEVVLGYKPRL